MIRRVTHDGTRVLSYNEGYGPINFTFRWRGDRVWFYVAIRVFGRFYRLHGGQL